MAPTQLFEGIARCVRYSLDQGEGPSLGASVAQAKLRDSYLKYLLYAPHCAQGKKN